MNAALKNNVVQGSTVETLIGLLTPRQAEANTWIAEGKEYSEAAQIMGCSERTVKAHVEDSMHRTDTHNRVQLIKELFLRGIMRGVAALLCITISASCIGPMDDNAVRSSTRNNTRIVRIVRLGRREIQL